MDKGHSLDRMTRLGEALGDFFMVVGIFAIMLVVAFLIAAAGGWIR